MALVKAADVQKEFHDAINQINTILVRITKRLDALESQKKGGK